MRSKDYYHLRKENLWPHTPANVLLERKRHYESNCQRVKIRQFMNTYAIRGVEIATCVVYSVGGIRKTVDLLSASVLLPDTRQGEL